MNRTLGTTYSLRDFDLDEHEIDLLLTYVDTFSDEAVQEGLGKYASKLAGKGAFSALLEAQETA